MPNLFGRTSPFDEAVDKICDVGTEGEDWQLIMNLCDTVNSTPNGPKLMTKALVKKIRNSNPSQLEHTATLMDACVNNCNRPFHLELCSRETLSELQQYMQKNRSPTKGLTALKEAMVKWAKAFGEDAQLYSLSVMIVNLKGGGVTFPGESGAISGPPVKTPAQSSRQENEDDMFKKAIELSLKESQGASGSKSNSAIYPTFTADKPLSTDRELFKVKALYDFEAAEENEITFTSGDVISVTDNTDQNWWKGRTATSSGLFPANFVTKQLESTPAPPKPAPAPEPVKITEVNPEQIDLLFEMLRNADAKVTNDEEDKYIQELENAVGQQSPLIQAEYEKLKTAHSELENINDDMSRVVGLYHKLLKEAPPVVPVQAPQPIHYTYHPGGGPQPVVPIPQSASEQQRHYPPPSNQYNQYNPGSAAQGGPPQGGPSQSQGRPPQHQGGPPQSQGGPPQSQGGPLQPQGGPGPPQSQGGPPQSQGGPPQSQGGPPQPHGGAVPPPTNYPSTSPPPSYHPQHPGYYPAYGGPPLYSPQPAPQYPSQPNIAHVSPMAQAGTPMQ